MALSSAHRVPGLGGAHRPLRGNVRAAGRYFDSVPSETFPMPQSGLMVRPGGPAMPAGLDLSKPMPAPRQTPASVTVLASQATIVTETLPTPDALPKPTPTQTPIQVAAPEALAPETVIAKPVASVAVDAMPMTDASGVAIDMGCLSEVISEVNTLLADPDYNDPALANVGMVRSRWGWREGSSSELAKANPAASPLKGEDAAWEDGSTETDAPQDFTDAELFSDPEPRRGILGLLGRRRQRRRRDALTVTIAQPESLNEKSEMTFQNRLARIQSGHQWQPEGVLQAVGKHGQSAGLPLGQKPGFRFAVLMMFVGGLTVWSFGPETIIAQGQALMVQVENLDIEGWKAKAGDIRLASFVPGL